MFGASVVIVFKVCNSTEIFAIYNLRSENIDYMQTQDHWSLYIVLGHHLVYQGFINEEAKYNGSKYIVFFFSLLVVFCTTVAEHYDKHSGRWLI